MALSLRRSFADVSWIPPMSSPEPHADDAEPCGFHLLGLPVSAEDHSVRSREPFEVLVSQFVEELRAGRKPSIELYARRFPPHADRIRDVFPVLAMLEHARVEKESRSIRQNMPGSIPFTRLGNCELLQELGRGGMGVVFRARDLQSGHLVALKVLPWRMSVVPEWVSRFEREARTVQQLHHPGIVPVFRSGQEDGYCFLVMQLIHGISLDRLIRALGTAPPTGLCLQELIPAPANTDQSTSKISTNTQQHVDTAPASTPPLQLTTDAWQHFTRIGLQTAHALHAAHTAGICHNDIKPGNLLIDRYGHVWITDFGLSQPIPAPRSDHLSRSATASFTHHTHPHKSPNPLEPHDSSFGGTLRYMAPERLSGHQSEAADIYALGATLYELCLQCAPFEHAQRDELRRLIQQQSPMAPSDLCRDFPRGLETIILNCLEKNPAYRYTTARQLIEDLLRFAQGDRIRRTRPGWLSLGFHRLRSHFQ